MYWISKRQFLFQVQRIPYKLKDKMHFFPNYRKNGIIINKLQDNEN